MSLIRLPKIRQENLGFGRFIPILIERKYTHFSNIKRPVFASSSISPRIKAKNTHRLIYNPSTNMKVRFISQLLVLFRVTSFKYLMLNYPDIISPKCSSTGQRLNVYRRLFYRPTDGTSWSKCFTSWFVTPFLIFHS